MYFNLSSVSPSEKKSNYLKALSNIVNKLPKQVQVTELPAVSKLSSTKITKIIQTMLSNVTSFVQLLSLLLEALSCPDQGVQLSTLSCLEPVLINPPPALIQQLEALVSRLLALITSPAMVSEGSQSVSAYKLLSVLKAAQGQQGTVGGNAQYTMTFLNSGGAVHYNVYTKYMCVFFLSCTECPDHLIAVYPRPFTFPCTWGKTSFRQTFRPTLSFSFYSPTALC